MRKIFEVTDGAQLVVLLWFGAALLPILILHGNGEVWAQSLGVLILFCSGFFVSEFRRYKKSKGEWYISDFSVYIAVPLILFGFIFYASLSGSNT